MDDVFQIVVMGCSGGPRENNLSGYLFSPLDANAWIGLDAGSLLGGIERALEKGSLNAVPFNDPHFTPEAEMFVRHIKAFLISHAHLDHIAGLVINSQIDQHKYLLGIDPTIDNIRDHIFNGRIWPNYGNEGAEPLLSRYEYIRLPLHLAVKIPSTPLIVESYLLCHPGGYPSTAFLIEYKDNYLLYVGDTSSDSLEMEKHLTRIWRRISPLIQEKKFRGMLLECSVSHRHAEQVLYGHLDSRLMMKELRHLEELAQTSLEGLKVVVTHRKESLMKDEDIGAQIQEELIASNDLGIQFYFPCQGDRITF